MTTTGRNELNVIAYKSLDSLNLTGIPNISWKRNKNLEIYVNFVNGTKPFWYCYQIFSSDKMNLICNDPDETTDNYFKVSKRFSRNGTYFLKIKAGNKVTKLEKSFPITVIDCKYCNLKFSFLITNLISLLFKIVEKQSQILFITIPIVAFIFILSIIFSGILYIINNKSKFRTEIADFDFVEPSACASEEVTFVKRLKHTFINSIKDTFQKKGDEETEAFKPLENVNNSVDT